MSDIFILIPSRIGSTRLENKPLQNIEGKSLVHRVFENALSITSNVYVATDSNRIKDNLSGVTNNIIMTSSEHISGTDRVYEASTKLNLKDTDLIINLQGDEPLISVKDINRLIKVIVRKKLKIGTLACKINDNKVKQKFNDKNIVKVKTYKKINRETFSVAKNFFRISKKNKNKNENCYQHIGIYIYKFEILKLFVSLKQTLREKKLKLEQLRALDNQIPINVVLAETKPMGIDTKSDFVKFKKILERNNF